MSQDLHAFFARVTEDPALQERLSPTLPSWLRSRNYS